MGVENLSRSCGSSLRFNQCPSKTYLKHPVACNTTGDIPVSLQSVGECVYGAQCSLKQAGWYAKTYCLLQAYEFIFLLFQDKGIFSPNGDNYSSLKAYLFWLISTPNRTSIENTIGNGYDTVGLFQKHNDRKISSLSAPWNIFSCSKIHC